MKSGLIALLFVVQAFLSPLAGAETGTKPEALGLPGDNLNLYAVLKAFQESPTLEAFEKRINSEESKINNLDLDGDGEIDYIRVEDHVTGNTHAISLTVDVGKGNSQDIAVIGVDKDDQGRVTVQVIGDEDLYGKDYIVEPSYDAASERAAGLTPNPGYVEPVRQERKSPEDQVSVVKQTTTVEVATWPVVQVIYVPAYRPWCSPYYWGFYPPWWRPRHPIFWHQYWGFHWRHHYHGHYRRGSYHRNPVAYSRYRVTYRSTTPRVRERIKSGGYSKTYSRPDLRRKGLEQGRRDVRTTRLPAVRPSGPRTPATRPKAPSGGSQSRPGGRPASPDRNGGSTLKPRRDTGGVS